MIPVGWDFSGYASSATQTFVMRFSLDSLGNPVANYNLTRTGGWPAGDGTWDGRVNQFFHEIRADGKCYITGVWTDVDGTGGVEWIFDDVAQTLDGTFWAGSIPSGANVWKAQRI